MLLFRVRGRKAPRDVALGPGELVEEIRLTAAGSAGGTALVLAKLGASVRSAGAIGTDASGDLLLGDLSPKGLMVLGKTHLLDPNNTDPHRPVLWVHPAFANKSIYWRSDKVLVCASLAAEGK